MLCYDDCGGEEFNMSLNQILTIPNIILFFGVIMLMIFVMNKLKNKMVYSKVYIAVENKNATSWMEDSARKKKTKDGEFLYILKRKVLLSLPDNKQVLQQQWLIEWENKLIWKDVPMVLEVLTSNKKL